MIIKLSGCNGSVKFHCQFKQTMVLRILLLLLLLLLSFYCGWLLILIIAAITQFEDEALDYQNSESPRIIGSLASEQNTAQQSCTGCNYFKNLKLKVLKQPITMGITRGFCHSSNCV